MDPSWNSSILEVAYSVCGWLAFAFWSACLYPQVLLNFRRKSVVGFNFNYALLNNTKHTVYFIYNALFYFSPAVQLEYHKTYGFQQMIPVAANDVAFSLHCALISLCALFQIAIYERGNQTFSKYTLALVCAVWIAIAVSLFLCMPTHSWLRFLQTLSTLQVLLTSIKYIPQAVMNYWRKSTEGFSIGYALLDFGGGTFNYAQMVMQSLDQNSWVNLYGNLGKLLLSLVSIFFDLVFMCQHYVLYPKRKAAICTKLDEQQTTEPLLSPSLDEEIAAHANSSSNKSSLENE